MKVKNLFNVPKVMVSNGTTQQWRVFEDGECLSEIQKINFDILDAGLAMEPHEHENEEQIYFILGGLGTVTVGNESKDVSEGDVIQVPPKFSHTIKNRGTYPLRFFIIRAPVK